MHYEYIFCNFRFSVGCIRNKSAQFAKRIYESMKGLGTDDDTLIRVSVSRCEVDMVQIAQEFKQRYDDDLAHYVAVSYILNLNLKLHFEFELESDINSLFPERCGFHYQCVIFKCVVVITFMSISSAFAFRWMTQGPADDKSTLVQVMAWCRQATSHYLNQCWVRSMMLYSITRPHWDIKNNAWVTVNNDFGVASEAICQWFSRVTKSWVKIIGKSHHEWPQNRYSR